MVHPEDKEDIIRKIKAIAEGGGEFTAYDCMMKHLGKHHSDDWAEVPKHLVRTGYLTGKGEGFYGRLYQLKEETVRYKVGDRVRNTGRVYSDLAKEGTVVSLWSNKIVVQFDDYQKLTCHNGDLELIKEGTMEVKSVYKVVRIEDGYKSIWCGSEKDNYKEGTELSYSIGTVTKAPTSQGIYLFKSLEGALRAYINPGGIGRSDKQMAVLECYPVGMVSSYSPSSEECHCPAVYVKAEVWREEEPRLEPKFKVGDRVKGVSSYEEGIDGLVIKEVFWGADRRLGGTPSYWLYKCDDGINYSDDMLELAPVEEWVDVTKECTLKPYPLSGERGMLVKISHKGEAIIWLGGNGVDKIHPDYRRAKTSDYRVELSGDTTGDGCAFFRVLRKA